jgi:hypothetical protein
MRDFKTAEVLVVVVVVVVRFFLSLVAYT